MIIFTQKGQAIYNAIRISYLDLCHEGYNHNNAFDKIAYSLFSNHSASIIEYALGVADNDVIVKQGYAKNDRV